MDLGLRQSDVAERIGVWTSTINYWENNRFNPEVQYVPKIVAFLEYDPFGPQPDGFPAQLKAARIAAGLTRRQLAVRLGVHAGTVAEWERGEARPAKVSRGRIRSTLGVSLDSLAFDRR
jgi:transcriptional regulator with XRE-family HTH domain